MQRFEIRFWNVSWPWNPGQGSLKVIENDTVWLIANHTSNLSSVVTIYDSILHHFYLSFRPLLFTVLLFIYDLSNESFPTTWISWLVTRVRYGAVLCVAKVNILIYLLNLQCNVPPSRAPSALSKPLVLFCSMHCTLCVDWCRGQLCDLVPRVSHHILLDAKDFFWKPETLIFPKGLRNINEMSSPYCVSSRPY